MVVRCRLKTEGNCLASLQFAPTNHNGFFFLHSLPSTIRFKLEYALVYEFYAKLSQFSVQNFQFGSSQRCWQWNIWQKMMSKLTSKRHHDIMHKTGYPTHLICLCWPHEETLAPWLPIKCTANSNQTGRMHRLIRVFDRRTSFCWFCHAAAQLFILGPMFLSARTVTKVI